MKCDLLGSLIEKLEAFWPFLADSALEGAEFGLMNLPGTLDFLVEAQLVAHGNCSKHSAIWKK